MHSSKLYQMWGQVPQNEQIWAGKWCAWPAIQFYKAYTWKYSGHLIVSISVIVFSSILRNRKKCTHFFFVVLNVESFCHCPPILAEAHMISRFCMQPGSGCVPQLKCWHTGTVFNSAFQLVILFSLSLFLRWSLPLFLLLWQFLFLNMQARPEPTYRERTG